MNPTHAEWIGELKRQALIEELEEQERDISRAERDIAASETRIAELTHQRDQAQRESVRLIGLRNASQAAAAALREELGL